MPDAALHTVQEPTIPAVLSTLYCPKCAWSYARFPLLVPLYLSRASYPYACYRLIVFPTEKKLKKIAHG